MFGVIFKGFFFLSIMFWYTLSVWNLVNDYFKEEVKKYLLSQEPDQEKFNFDQKMCEAFNYEEDSLITSYILKKTLFTNGVCYRHVNNVNTKQECKKATFF